MKVSLYRDVQAKEPAALPEARKVVESIIRPVAERQRLVAACRAAVTAQALTAAKAKLPCVAWAGEFDGRGKRALRVDSGLRLVDVDPSGKDVENKAWREQAAANAASLRRIVLNAPWCQAAWVSASGYGVGVLALTDDWQAAKAAVGEYVLPGMLFEIDEHCKDSSRLNFLSFDPQARWNEHPEPAPPPAPAPQSDPPSSPEAELPAPAAPGAPNISGAIAAIGQGLAGEYPAGKGTYPAWSRMTFSIKAYGGEALREAWADWSARCGRIPTRNHPTFVSTWENGNGTLGGGLFVKTVRDNSESRGLDNPLEPPATLPEDTLARLRAAFNH